jgi:dienelactone hydrolase
MVTIRSTIVLVGAVLLATLTARAEDQVRFQPLETKLAVPHPFALAEHTFPFVIKEQPGQQRLSPSGQFEVTFPSPVTTPHECNNTVHCEYFPPRGSGRHPGVIVLHILGGDFELSRLCCRSLAWHGVGALFVKLPYYGPRRPTDVRVRMVSEDLELTVACFRQAVLDIRRATAWLASRSEIDASRLGITGISLGGIVSALAAASEPRLQRVCLVLAGGNMQQIILQSDETRKIRDVWAQRQFNPEQVLGQLREIDPLTYAANLKSRELLMFNARHDTVIPRECTEALWKAMGEPEIHWWNANHYSAIWYLPPALLQMSQFFARIE